MKKVFSMIALGLFLTASIVACTPVNSTNEYEATDPNQNCPPNDRNCNGIPDNQE